MIEITFSSEDLSRKINSLPKTVIREVVQEAIHPQLERIQTVAKYVHRFKRRTGALQRSIKVRKRVLGGSVLQDGRIAHYGIYVHEGHHSWQPDRFMYNAWKKNQAHFQRQLRRALNRAVRKAGLL
jgi:hypothetical protein